MDNDRNDHGGATRRSSSPTNESDSILNRPTPVSSLSPSQQSAAQTHSDSLLAVARRVDAGASIAAVTKASASTLVKINPGPDTGTPATLATLAALRLAFPFATVTAIEDFASGSTQFQILLHTNTEELLHAKEVCRQHPSMRALKVVSNAFAIGGLCTYAALLYAALIR